MAKKLLTITGLTLTTLYGILSYSIVAYSELPTPADSPYAQICGITEEHATTTDETHNNLCCLDYNAAMDAVEMDWDESLQALIDQEIPASEMVADAYESMRTYECWLEYICRAVEFSGHAPIESVEPGENGVSTGLTSQHIGVVPGCQKPEDMKMEKEWDSFLNDMRDVPILGAAAGAYGDYYISGKMNYFPRCMSSKEDNNADPNLPWIAKNYNECKEAIRLRFGCPPGVPDFLCTDESNAFVKIDNVLKKTHADQKSSALERKLGEIVKKTQTMEEHVTYVSNFLQQLNSRLACFADKCT